MPGISPPPVSPQPDPQPLFWPAGARKRRIGPVPDKGTGKVRRLWGPETEKAKKNFNYSPCHVSDKGLHIRACASVKKACALANIDAGALSQERADAIIRACDELIRGEHADQFPLDVIQGGAGTSTNMNVNEVIASLAESFLPEGAGPVHPNDQVNLSQSTNDTYPTAVKLSLLWESEDLISSLTDLKREYLAKAEAHKADLKPGRTQLMNAVEMTFGMEFGAVATRIDELIGRLQEARGHLLTINLGGTAIGTGANTPGPGYGSKATAHLRDITGMDFKVAGDLVAATSDMQPFVDLANATDAIAIGMGTFSNDLRLLNSGPNGFGEYILAKRQNGSSIMPGKVNPVIPEGVNSACFRTRGLSEAVRLAAGATQLQLNAFEPMMYDALSEGIHLLSRAARQLGELAIRDLTVNRDSAKKAVLGSPSMATHLVGEVGYDQAAEIARESRRSGRPVAEVARGMGLNVDHLLTEEALLRGLGIIRA